MLESVKTRKSAGVKFALPEEDPLKIKVGFNPV